VNSINIARVLAQCVYYIWAWLKLPESARATAEYVVPTGNFGNVLAGWLAQQMGMPTSGFRVATNQNDILHRFFTSGDYQEERRASEPCAEHGHPGRVELRALPVITCSVKTRAKVREVMAQIKSGGAVQDRPAKVQPALQPHG
jgi:threonine synthase